MPDISMCKDEQCKKKEECYRYKAKPSEFMQAYFVGTPSETDVEGNVTCRYFMEIWKNALPSLRVESDQGLANA